MLSSLRRQRPASASAPRLPDAAALLAALPDPVLALDRDNIVRFVNPAAEQFFGTSAAGLSGHPFAEIVAPQSPVFALLESGSPQRRLDRRIRRADRGTAAGAALCDDPGSAGGGGV
jgi:two-component system nitrogen regulation sensor histidine kinase GlnL